MVENNLGFCMLQLGNHERGLEIIEEALTLGYDPLFELNRGIGLYLLGKKELARESLDHALTWMKENKKNRYSNENPVVILLIDPTSKTARPVLDVPLTAAILLNLWAIGILSKEEVQKQMEEAFPKSHRSLLLLTE